MDRNARNRLQAASLAVLCTALALSVARTAAAAPAAAKEEHPAWVILPGHENAVTELLAPYWQAPKPPSVAKAMIRQTVVEAEADSGVGKGTIVLRHPSNTAAPGGELLKGEGGQLDIDLQCPTCTDAGKAALRSMATAILAHQKATNAQIWSANPDKGKRAQAPAQAGKSVHAKTRILVALGGLALALIAGILIARSRRRKAVKPAPAAPEAQAADTPEAQAADTPQAPPSDPQA